MSDDGQDGDEWLGIELDGSTVSVSYLSSLLRVVEAPLREVARSDEGTRQLFERRPQPRLLVPGSSPGGKLSFRLTFADTKDARPLEEFSSTTFNAFLDRFEAFVRRLPQPGLWGGASRRPPASGFESEIERRIDQLYRELRRDPKVTMRFKGRAIEVEGDRMEIV